MCCAYVVDGARKSGKTSRKADDAVEEEAHPRRVARKMRAATEASDEASDAPVVQAGGEEEDSPGECQTQ